MSSPNDWPDYTAEPCCACQELRYDQPVPAQIKIGEAGILAHVARLELKQDGQGFGRGYGKIESVYPISPVYGELYLQRAVLLQALLTQLQDSNCRLELSALQVTIGQEQKPGSLSLVSQARLVSISDYVSGHGMVHAKNLHFHLWLNQQALDESTLDGKSIRELMLEVWQHLKAS